MKKLILAFVFFGATTAFAGAPTLVCENETGVVALVKQNGAFPIIDLYQDLTGWRWTFPKGQYTRASSPVDTDSNILTVCNEGYYMTLQNSNTPGYTSKISFVCRIDSAPTQVIELADVNCWD